MGWKIVKVFKEMNPIDQAISIISVLISIYALISLPYPFGLPYPYNLIIIAVIIVLYGLWLVFFSSVKNIIRDSPVELSDQWFQEKYESYIEPFTDKFSFEAELHTKTNIDEQIHEFLLDDEFLLVYKKRYNKLKNDLNNFNNSLMKLDKELPQESKWGSKKLELIEKADKIKKCLDKIRYDLFYTSGLLKKGDFEKIKQIDFQELYDHLELTFKEYEKLEKDIDFSKINFTGNEEEINKSIKKAKEIIAGPSDSSL